MKSLSKTSSKGKSQQQIKSEPAVFLRRKTDLPINAEKKELLGSIIDCQDDCKFYRRKNDLERIKALSDSELVLVIQSQDGEAYHELFDRYQKKLFAYIFHLVRNSDEAEDILQNVFSKTYRSIANFDTSRKFSSWIYRIAHNESVNFLKRRSKRYVVSWDDISSSKDKLDTATNEELPEDKWEHQEIGKEIGEAMKELPEKYQQILELRYFKETSYEEMGKILGKPVNTVGTLINRAKSKLFEVIQERGVYKK